MCVTRRPATNIKPALDQRFVFAEMMCASRVDFFLQCLAASVLLHDLYIAKTMEWTQ